VRQRGVVRTAEIVDLGVGDSEHRLADPPLRSSRARVLDHPLGQVDPDGSTRRAESLREHERRRPVAAPDIEHTLAVCGRRGRDETLGERGEHLVVAVRYDHPLA
jgi:hypothetical protein